LCSLNVHTLLSISTKTVVEDFVISIEDITSILSTVLRGSVVPNTPQPISPVNSKINNGPGQTPLSSDKSKINQSILPIDNINKIVNKIIIFKF